MGFGLADKAWDGGDGLVNEANDWFPFQVCGLVHMAEAASRPAFIFWLIVFVILSFMFLYQLAIIIIKYIQMPAMVDTDIYYSQLVGQND